MTRRMLINAQNPEEVRVAIISGSQLENFQIEVAENGITRGNIYRGTITNVQPSLNAAFVNYGAARDGFLPMKEIVEKAYHRNGPSGRPARINEVLERGKPIIVQVTKEPEGQKGGALTTDVSLAGRYLVLTPFDDTRGVSRKVEDEEERAKLRDMANEMKVPAGGGFIVRTNALGQSKTTLTKDFTSLVRVWKKIQADFKKATERQLLYADQDLITRVLRDYVDATLDEILIDDDYAFNVATDYVKSFMPRTKLKLVRYTEREPIFSRYQIEKQVERIYERTVPLKSGGSIVIDRTEALVAIDVNSGSTKGGNQEQTAYNTNLEAAEEVARQLRLRDIGGLIVVDFIDMRSRKFRSDIERTLREAMKVDKARFTVGKISPNGLLEINRQRLQQALHLRTHRPCPTCSGTGRIASPEMVGLNLLRRIEERAVGGRLRGVRVALHPELADAFQNQRRRQIAKLEEEFDISVEIIAASHLHRPEQEVEWFDRPQEQQPKVETAEKPIPSLPATPSQPAAAEGGRSRRRKKKKRRDGEVEPRIEHPAVHAVETIAPYVEEEEEDETPGVAGSQPQPVAGEGHGRKRRRRRRRRGGSEAAAQQMAMPEAGGSEPLPSFWMHEPESDDAPAQNEAAMPVVAAEGPSQATHSDHAHAHEAPRGRKRRRRRGGNGHGGGQQHETAAAAAVPDNPMQPAPVAAEGGEAHSGRKRRRRKRRGGERGAQHAEGGTATVEAPPVTAPVQVAPNVVEPPAKAPGPRRPRPAAKTATVAAAPAEAAPKRVSRKRREASGDASVDAKPARARSRKSAVKPDAPAPKPRRKKVTAE